MQNLGKFSENVNIPQVVQNFLEEYILIMLVKFIFLERNSVMDETPINVTAVVGRTVVLPCSVDLVGDKKVSMEGDGKGWVLIFMTHTNVKEKWHIHLNFKINLLGQNSSEVQSW